MSILIKSSIPKSFITHNNNNLNQFNRNFFNLPSPFSSSLSSSSSSTANKPKGTLKKKGNLWIYTESQEMNFTAKELYSIVADVDSYKDFLPFTTESKVLNSQLVNLTTKERMKTNLNEKGWLNLNDNNEGELFELEAELKIGAMGYNESYISLVKAKKWESVSATAKDSKIFKHLSTEWKLTELPNNNTSPKKTKVELYLAYQFISPFHAAAVSAMWEKISGLMIIGFRKRVEDVYNRK